MKIDASTLVFHCGIGVASLLLFAIGLFFGSVLWMPVSFIVAIPAIPLGVQEHIFLIASVTVIVTGMVASLVILMKLRFPSRPLVFATLVGIAAGAFAFLMSTAPHFRLRS